MNNLRKFSKTFISRSMGKKEKNTIAAKAKKLLNTSTSPELLTKPVSSSVNPMKQGTINWKLGFIQSRFSDQEDLISFD